ncbi:hypothetical protein K378_01370 [Streptomyces sp. Amel2xB2]|uniref:hypothetical protein n=1 Tax=Streptomyces sp. Amel2xB2 TaxID=1305829 RepID=UPI000DBAC6AA|nr:hypothetical protein [Streptomyces sp. Amel2xB2]RAJ70205.1 hypothetical protein K378_01370 [Streptomyces sp. Amel2xB2]
MNTPADGTEFVEYGIAGLPNKEIADRTTNDFYARARLATYQQCWPSAYLVTRTVRASAWERAQDGGRS